MNKSIQPFFIFGIARSGTNLISGILNTHPNLNVILDPLLPFFKSARDQWLYDSSEEELKKKYPPNLSLQDYYFDPLGFKLLDFILSKNFDVLLQDEKLISVISERVKIDTPSFVLKLNNLKINRYDSLLNKIFREIVGLSKTEKKIPGIKEVWSSEFIPALSNLYPKGKFIFVQRDPRAIISSLLALAEKDSSQQAHPPSYMRHWRKEVALIHHLKRLNKFKKRILIIKYEDIVYQPKKNILKLCQFLKIPFSNSMFKPTMGYNGQYSSNSSFEKFDGISTNSVNRWKSFLSNDLKKITEYICGPEMFFLDYINREYFKKSQSNSNVLLSLELLNKLKVSWRSDYGTIDEQISYENKRYELLNSNLPIKQNYNIIRKNFLFEKFFIDLKNKYFDDDNFESEYLKDE